MVIHGVISCFNVQGFPGREGIPGENGLRGPRGANVYLPVSVTII